MYPYDNRHAELLSRKQQSKKRQESLKCDIRVGLKKGNMGHRT